MNSNLEIISEVKNFLDGENDELKYIVNVEADKNTNKAQCIVDNPETNKKSIDIIEYTPFLFIKDLNKRGIVLYNGDKELRNAKMIEHGIKIKKLETGQQKRLEDGFCYKVTSSKSFNNIILFFKQGGIDPYEKRKNSSGRVMKDKNGRPIYKNRDLFYYVRPEEQFLIDKKTRLYKGFEYYENIHKLVLDIETTGLRYSISRIFSIGIKDNRGFETILEVDKEDDDESERKIIIKLFEIINYLSPSIISGYNSEEFDFDFILNRAKILEIDLKSIKTTLDKDKVIDRKPSTVKIGGDSIRYMSTIIWGISVIDIIHAVKKAAVMDTDIKEFGLKYICKYADIAKPNRMYIDGDDDGIYKMWKENKMFFINPDNNHYIQIPDEYQNIGYNLFKLQNTKKELSNEEYKKIKNNILKNNSDFVVWYKKQYEKEKYTRIINGKKILRQYLLDDLWETEKVDELYNQSSFLLAKIIPTVYARICTMGTASIWNLLLTAWSYNNNIAIPDSDEKSPFIGGLSRCFKNGYNDNIIKIDFASLYPMIQLSYDVFPIFDITNIIKKILLYMTTTRNVYKKMANEDTLSDLELEILKMNKLDDIVKKYNDGLLSKSERKMFKVKQLPLKTLNNSLFGALGSAYSFKWSDNLCAGRITNIGRLELRKAIKWFEKYGCKPLLCVTDGINFSIPRKTNIIVNENKEYISKEYLLSDDAWKYNDKRGISALIEKFNKEVMIKYMAVDDDGRFISCMNLKKNNYALLEEKDGEKKIKFIGGMIKNRVMPEYIKDFIDKGLMLILEGKGYEFVEYYISYSEDIFYKRIPLKKIATKKRIKTSIEEYKNRGCDKNGRIKAKQAHMELIIEERNNLVKNKFKENYDEILKIYGDEIKSKYDDYENMDVENFELEDLYKYTHNWMPNEPDLDSTVYLINTGNKKSDGDSTIIKDLETGEERMASSLINKKDLEENPNMLGEYNVDKYLNDFNKKVNPLLVVFNKNIREKILTKIKVIKYKDEFGVKRIKKELVKNLFKENELKLIDDDLDDLNEAITLQDEEILFWNRYGYNPNKIWDGYIVNKNKLRYDIYEKAYNYLNEQIKNNGNKYKIKKIDDQLNKGDLVLLKDKNIFNVGYYNGQYIRIVRENVKIPNIDIIYYDDNYVYEKEFRKKYKISDKIKLSELFTLQPKAKQAYDDLVLELTDDQDYDDYEI